MCADPTFTERTAAGEFGETDEIVNTGGVLRSMHHLTAGFSAGRTVACFMAPNSIMVHGQKGACWSNL